MEGVINNNKIKEMLQQQINNIVENKNKQYNEMLCYIENEKKQIEIMKNKTKEKKLSINRINHEIEANTVLVTELKESILEEEKKLEKYPKLISEIDRKLTLVLKNFDFSKSEYKTIKLHKDYVQNEWEKKLETLYNLLGFKIIIQDDKIIIEFSSIQEADPQKKYIATIALSNGLYEAINTKPHINNFEDYVDRLNNGLPFTAFCCLLRRSFKELK